MNFQLYTSPCVSRGVISFFPVLTDGDGKEKPILLDNRMTQSCDEFPMDRLIIHVKMIVNNTSAWNMNAT